MAPIGYGYGSEWHLTVYLARRRKALNSQIQAVIGCEAIDWLDFDASGHELKGLDFLHPQDPARQDWERQWPQTGNVQNWDAVGKTTLRGGAAWLPEAKAHTHEMISSCAATEASKTQIKNFIEEHLRAARIKPVGDVTQKYYQYCNRLALTQFLRKAGIDAHLLMLYFTGDRQEVQDCPPDAAGWKQAIKVQNNYLGLQADPGWVHKLFIPVLHITEERSARARAAGLKS